MSSDLPLELLKLTTGEQIIGKVDTPAQDVIRVYEPLAFETGASSTEDLSRRYVYMSRYVPFMAEQVVDISLQQVIFHGRPSDSVTRYYEASLAFCQRTTDVDFENCLNETSESMEDSVSEMDVESAIISAPSSHTESANQFTEQVFQNILLAALPTSNTAH